jgi:hypothetical protein
MGDISFILSLLVLHFESNEDDSFFRVKIVIRVSLELHSTRWW